MPGFKRTCVDLWFGLTSSSHVCKWAWLGHCMTMWPCCRFITFFLPSYLHNDIFLPPTLFICKKKKKTWQAHCEVCLSCSCHAYQVVCRALTFFVSQVRTVKYIQWMIFNRYPLPVVQCNTLETMQVFFFFFFSFGVTLETVFVLGFFVIFYFLKYVLLFIFCFFIRPEKNSSPPLWTLINSTKRAVLQSRKAFCFWEKRNNLNQRGI